MSEPQSQDQRLVIAEPGDADVRLDRMLATRLSGLSRSRVKTLIMGGAVTRDGDIVNDPALRVRAGQTFAIIIPEATPAVPEPQALPLVVVYEDEDLIVVDKPAGLVVHPAPGNPDGTLVNGLLAHCGDSLSGIGGVRRPGIVHRLDKNTSGLMVAAKNDMAHRALSDQFATHDIERRYQALVWGVPRPRSGEISGSIGRDPHNRKRMAMVRRGGKPARTEFRVLSAYGPTYGGTDGDAGPAASLVQCRLHTGRTHQVRVHLTFIGHPIIGDRTYGRNPGRRLASLGASARQALACLGRQALHAEVLGFRHPRTAEPLQFASQLPCDIKGFVAELERL